MNKIAGVYRGSNAGSGIGFVSDDSVQSVELVYEDGERTELPFVWVSDPVGAGFYAYDFADHLQNSRQTVIGIVGRDSSGKATAQTCLAGLPLSNSPSGSAAICKGLR
jgi:hypothetical protein